MSAPGSLLPRLSSAPARARARSARRALVVGLSVLGLCTTGGLPLTTPGPSGGIAHAEDAESLIRRGLELRKSGQDQEALALFQQAIAVKRTPRALTQLGMCEQALGLWPQAESHLEEALQAESDPWIKKNATLLRDSLTFVRSNVARLEVWGSPQGAKVTIDHVVVGALPLPSAAHLTEGRRVVIVEAPGYVTETRTVAVKGGALMREHVTLEKAPPPSLAVRQATGDTAATTTLVSPQKASSEPAANDDGSPFYKTWWFWTLTGAVVIGAGAATYFATRSSGCKDTSNTSCW